MSDKDKYAPSAQDEMTLYNSLLTKKLELEGDLKTITHIYGKVTSSHDYKEFANKTNQLMQKVQSQVKELAAKIAQWDTHFKAQAQYQEMLKYEQKVNELYERYM